MKKLKIAVVGAGISGLSCAYRLVQSGAQVTLFEAGDYFGGHANTVTVNLDGVRHGVDTGFLVFNERTYPQLIALFEELGVVSTPSEMSFSVTAGQGRQRLEWAGSNLNSVFAQRSNLFKPRFLRMLSEILRFNRAASALALEAGLAHGSLGAYLEAQTYSREFRDWYLLPMASCIWSCPASAMLDFPLASFVRFCHNHGLLQISDRPQWRSLQGGSRNYVHKLIAGIPDARLSTPVRRVVRNGMGGQRSVRIDSAAGVDYYDQVVLACHSDQAGALLGDPEREELAVLSAVAYQQNHAVLHTDISCLPQRRSAWSAWNYQSSGGAEPRVCVHYLLNRLQQLPFSTPVIVSLNPLTAPAPSTVLARFEYAHPVFDVAAMAAQAQLAQIQGRRNTWFAGAWTGYGFHEDGLKSGLAVAAALTRLQQQQQQHAAA